MAGRQTEAQATLDRFRALTGQPYVPSYSVAAIYAALGGKDQAFTWLERLRRARQLDGYPGLDPRLDPLQSDARSSALLPTDQAVVASAG